MTRKEKDAKSVWLIRFLCCWVLVGLVGLSMIILGYDVSDAVVSVIYLWWWVVSVACVFRVMWTNR